MPHEVAFKPAVPPDPHPLDPHGAKNISGELWSMAEELAEIGSFDRNMTTGQARVSDKMCQIYGLERRVLEASSEAWTRVIHPEDRARVSAALRNAANDRAGEAHFQYRIVRPNGDTRWISTRVRLEYGERGDVVRRYGVNQDITDRYQTTMAHAHLAAVVASSSEAIKSYSLDGRILSWNPGAERLFGFSALEAVGQSIEILVPPDRREEARGKLEAVRHGGHVRLETVRRRKDGSLVDVAISASPVRDGSGRIVAVSALAHDIGPRKAANRALERYRLLSEHARDILFVLREDGSIIETNAAAVAAYGYERDELLRMNIADIRAPQALATLQADLERVNGGTLFETQHQRRNGSAFPVEVSAVDMVIDGERLILSLVRDVSERKEWARVQRLMTRELLHRVKNSVAVIQSLVRLTAPRARTLDEFVASLTGRLAAMAAAHDLLSEMHWRGADLAELVTKQLAHYLSGPDRRVHMGGPKVRLPQQYAVPLALALHELATNAAKHGSLSTPEGRVDLGWRRVGPRNERLRIEWRESGGPPVEKPGSVGFGSTLIERGMPGAKVERRFDPAGLFCSIEIDVAPAGARPRRR